jgi:HNH endonuclease
MTEPRDGNFDAEYLRKTLKYDPDTGLWWKRPRQQTRGPRTKDGTAGYIDSDGRRRLHVNGHRYYANRLAWLYMTGEWPSLEVDHEDRDTSNDRWGNLRLATEAQQHANNSRLAKDNTGVLRIHQRSNGKFRVKIRRARKAIFQQDFDTLEEAIIARDAAMKELFGEFAPKYKEYTGKDLFK